MLEENQIRNNIHVIREGDTSEVFIILDAGNDLEVKAPNDANWHPAVMYQSTASGDNKRRVRPRVDFAAKFSLVPELGEDD